MDLLDSLHPVISLCQKFGVVAFNLKRFSGKLTLLESRTRSTIVKVNSVMFVLLQGLLLYSIIMDFKRKGENFCVRVVRIVHLFAFTGNMGALFETIINKGRKIGSGLNKLNELFVKHSREAKLEEVCAFNRRFLLLGVLNYVVTVVPLLTTAIYVKRSLLDAINYTHYGVCLWMENVFLSFFTSVVYTVAKVYGSLTRLTEKDKLRLREAGGLCLLRRKLLNEEGVKDFLEMFFGAHQYMLFFCVLWSHSMVLLFVMKYDLKVRVAVWAAYISYRMVTIIWSCNAVRKEAQVVTSGVIYHSEDSATK